MSRGRALGGGLRGRGGNGGGPRGRGKKRGSFRGRGRGRDQGRGRGADNVEGQDRGGNRGSMTYRHQRTNENDAHPYRNNNYQRQRNSFAPRHSVTSPTYYPENRSNQPVRSVFDHLDRRSSWSSSMSPQPQSREGWPQRQLPPRTRGIENYDGRRRSRDEAELMNTDHNEEHRGKHRNDNQGNRRHSNDRDRPTGSVSFNETSDRRHGNPRSSSNQKAVKRSHKEERFSRYDSRYPKKPRHSSDSESTNIERGHYSNDPYVGVIFRSPVAIRSATKSDEAAARFDAHPRELIPISMESNQTATDPDKPANIKLHSNKGERLERYDSRYATGRRYSSDSESTTSERGNYSDQIALRLDFRSPVQSTSRQHEDTADETTYLVPSSTGLQGTPDTNSDGTPLRDDTFSPDSIINVCRPHETLAKDQSGWQGTPDTNSDGTPLRDDIWDATLRVSSPVTLRDDIWDAMLHVSSPVTDLVPGRQGTSNTNSCGTPLRYDICSPDSMPSVNRRLETLANYPAPGTDFHASSAEETDQRPCAEDQFTVADSTRQSTETKEEEPCYHPEQIEMASVLLERVEEILFRNVHSLRSVRAYENFEFIIYTAKSKMLEKQTISRLCDPGTECFPKSIYRIEARALEDLASRKVWMFLVENIEKAHNLIAEKVRQNPKTLYLIVADEAHSAVTKETTHKKAAAANNTVVNSWDAQQHPNVVVLQVTATPFNLLTKRTRIPNVIVAKPLHLEVDTSPTPEECQSDVLSRDGRKLKNVDRGGRGSHKLYIDKKDVTVEYSLPVKLHHVRWSEQLLKRLASPIGLVMRIQVPCDHMDWLTINQNSNDVFQEVTTTSNEEEATEFLFQGQDGIITIHTVNKKWQLVVHDNKDDRGRSRLKVAVRNLTRAKPQVDFDESFRMSLEYGEDVFQLEATMTKLRNTHGQTTRKSVRFNPEIERLEIGMKDNTDENSVASLVPSSTAHSFFIDTRRNLGDTRPNASYISLNRMFNSMRYKEEGAHLLRHDSVFEDVCDHVKNWHDNYNCINKTNGELTASSLTDVHAAVFAYWILVVENFELFKERQNYQNFDDFLAGGLKNYRGQYTEAHSQTLEVLEKELRRNKAETPDYPSIHPEVFKAVKCFYSNAARSELARCMNERLPASDRHAIYVNNVWQALAKCVVHMGAKELDDVENNILSFGTNMKHAEKKRRLLNETFSDEFHPYFEAEHLFEQDESCKVVSQLIHPFRRETNSAVKGNLIIVKVLSVPDGNRLYKTVCIARKVTQERLFYTFEVLRDYGNFDITSVNRDTKEPLFRVRRKLQPEQCEYRDEYGRRCKCEHYETVGKNLRCRSEHCKGKHKHKKVRKYEDMRNLSCLLILLKKGRLGDTFPDSFATLDLRITTTKRPENFSLITQDLGRMCRYVKKGDASPVALLGTGLHDILKKNLSHQAVFHGPFIMSSQDNETKGCGAIHLDSHCKWVNGEIMPDASSFDHENTSGQKHQNRLLLEAEPQIGKTGVYLKLISVLRKTIQGDEADESEEEIVFEETDEDQHQPVEVTIDSEKWKFPYWKDMQKGPHLPRRYSTGDSVPFEYNHCPTGPDVAQSFEGPTRIRVQPQILRRSSFLAHTSKHASESCVECNELQYTTAKVTQYSLNGNWIDISVPNHEYFDALQEASRSPMNYMQRGNISGREKLVTWIFTPVRPGRCNTGNLNLRHTMVDTQSEPAATVPYVHILVVSEEEFEEYTRQWRSTHAIIKRPDVDGSADGAKKLIQDTALCLGLDKIFIMDDNIPFVYTCIVEQNGHEMRVKNSANKMAGVKNIPLFDVLKQMESLFDASLPPPDVKMFEPHPTSTPNSLHAYTGPSETYGIFGICCSLRQQSKAREGFGKTLLCSLMLLNLSALRSKDINYQPWPVHADYQLSVQCDKNNLVVCRYNRFVMAKSVVRKPRIRRRQARYSTESDTDGEIPRRRQSGGSFISAPLAEIPTAPDYTPRRSSDDATPYRVTEVLDPQLRSLQCNSAAGSSELSVSFARSQTGHDTTVATDPESDNYHRNENVQEENEIRSEVEESMEQQIEHETEEDEPSQERGIERGSEFDESDTEDIVQHQVNENHNKSDHGRGSEDNEQSQTGENDMASDSESDAEDMVHSRSYENNISSDCESDREGIEHRRSGEDGGESDSQLSQTEDIDTEENRHQGGNVETGEENNEDVSPQNTEAARSAQCGQCRKKTEEWSVLMKEKIDFNEKINRLTQENTKLYEENANLHKENAVLQKEKNDAVIEERARNMRLSRMILELQEQIDKS